MQRRTFLQGLTAVAAVPATANLARASDAPLSAASLRTGFVQRNDQRIARIMQRQILRKDSPCVGGFPNQQHICFVGAAAWNIAYLTAGYVLKDSQYFQSSELEERLNLAAAFLGRMQHPDGTIDLVSTNFHSPPDTGFVVEPIALALGVIRRLCPDKLPDFQAAASTFLVRAGNALVHGGIHTPNHRWVVCAALARIHQLHPDQRLVHRIEQWLAEGIDIDEDGQYTERSTSVYTPLVNRCLITVARLLERPALYGPVRRNLELTRYLVYPNGELVTEISRRQDRAQRRPAILYYYPYRRMAVLDNDGNFAAMAQFIERTAAGDKLFDYTLYGLEDPVALSPTPIPKPLVVDYEKFFPVSQLVRIRRDRMDATILAEHSTPFSLRQGGAILQGLRLASAFFGKGQFRASSLERRDDGYVLTQELAAGYWQPLDEDQIPGDGDWSKMPRETRDSSGERRLVSQISIREVRGTFRLRFKIQGTKRVPWAMEFGLRKGGQLSGVRSLDGVEGAYLPTGSAWSYRVGSDEIRVSHGPVEHQWVQLRGAEPKLEAECVYFTGFTPLDLELTVG